MTKVTSKLLTLMLSLAMVFTSMGWLGSIEVNAAEGDTSLNVKVVDSATNAPLSGVTVTLYDPVGEQSRDFVPAETGEDGLASYDAEGDSGELFPGDEYFIQTDAEGYTADDVPVVFAGTEDAMYIDTVGGEAYSQSTPYVIAMDADEVEETVDFVDMQKNDKESWGDYGIDYEDIDAEDFILDVRKAELYEAGHMYGAVNADVTVSTDYREGGYIAAETDTATKLDAAYAEAGDRMIVIICNTGNSLAAKAMQYYNETGKDMDNITYLIGGKDSIPAADMLTNAPDTEVPRTTGEARSKTMTTTIDMSKYEGGKVVKVWVPVPHTEDFQTISEPKFDAPTAAVAEINEDANGNKMLYLEWAADADPATRTATLTFNASRVEAGHSELVKYDDSAFVWPEDVAPYITKTSEYVKIDGIVKEYADQITEGKAGTLDKARAIYDWVIANLERIDNGETLKNASGVEKTFVVEGCGYGDTVNILSDVKNFGRGGGHCTDINSTFVALCRAAGIPAREMFGIRLGTNEADDASGFQHCWAEFYLPGTGWVFADPGDVLKAIKPAKGSPISAWEEARASETFAQKADYFWGTVDNNRIVLSRGRDIKFVPEQAWGVCNTFGYPAAEVDGQRTPEDFTVAKNFVYSIATKDVVDFVKLQATDKDTWKTYGIEYADITSDDFILDVRPEAKWNEGHLKTAVHVDVTDSAQLEDGYIAEGSAIAKGLDTAYAAAGSKRIVIICNGGQTLAARAMQYLNESGKDMDNVTYLIGGRTSIPEADIATSDWALDDFVIEGTVIKGLSDSGKEKLKANSTLELPDQNADGDFITEIGAGANGQGTFGFVDGEVTYVPTQVKLPVALENIGNFAFSAAVETYYDDNDSKHVKQTGLTSVDFPATLKSIGMSAFANAPMTEVVIPDSVTTLGSGAFTGLEGIDVKIKKVTLSKNLTGDLTGTFFNQGIEGELVIPDGITKIGSNTFSGNRITRVVLPEGLTDIGMRAFQSTDLEEVEIPGSVEKIGSSAFNFTNVGGGRESKLTKVVLNEGTTTINGNAFAGNKITEVELPESVINVNKDAFKGNAQMVRLIAKNDDQANATGAYTKVVINGSGHVVMTKTAAATEDIANLPTEVTEENAAEAAAAVEKARASYDALSEEEKAALPAGTVEKLEAAEAKVEAAGAKAEAATAKAEAQAAADKLSATLDLVNEVIESITVSKSKYKTASVKTFTKALAAAQDLLKAETQTTEELTAAATTLKEAREGLVVKSANPLKVTKKDKTVKAKKAKKKAQTVKKAVIVKDNKGKVSYKKSGGSAKLTVNAKNGNITVKKGTKKGTYSIKVKVTAKGDGNYKSGSKTVTVKIKVN